MNSNDLKFGLKMSLTFGITSFLGTSFLSFFAFLVNFPKACFMFKVGLIVSFIGFFLIFLVTTIGPLFFNAVWDFLGKYLGDD